MSDSTGRTALTIAGQAIGYAIGGPFGAAIGGYIGGAIGYELFPLDPVYGPRATDLKLQASTYGLPIPFHLGTNRFAGNLFWSSPIRETEVATEVGGKGGPEQTVVNYAYDVDMAIGLCRGEILGIRRIWADGRLVYDISASSSPGTLLQSGEFSRSITIYTGSESQLPDPTIEASEGVGQVPGYRGLAYVLHVGFQLGPFGNRRPNLEYEVVKGTGVVGPQRLVNATPGPSIGATVIYSGAGGVLRAADASIHDVTCQLYDTSGNLVGVDATTEEERAWPISDPFVNHKAVTRTLQGEDVYGQLGEYVTGGAQGEFFAVFLGGAETDIAGELLSPGEFVGAIVPCIDRIHFLLFWGPSATQNNDEWAIVRWDGGDVTIVRQGTSSLGNSIGSISNSAFSTVAVLESDLTHFWQGSFVSVGPLMCWRIEDDGTTITQVAVFQQSTADGLPTGSNRRGAMWADKGVCFCITEGAFTAHTRLDTLPQATETLASSVTQICAAAGIDASEIDVTALTGTVRGYTVGRLSNARAALETLRAGFFFDSVESDDKVRFVSRGGASVATFAEDDLGIADDADGRVASSRRQETELPAHVTVRYISRDADYQQGAQPARRTAMGSRERQVLDLPIVFTDAEGANVADVTLTALWQERTPRRWKSSRKYARVEPTDPVTLLQTVDGVQVAHSVRVTSKREAGGRIDWEGVDQAAAAYTPSATGSPTGDSQVLQPRGPTRAELMDLPALRDTDDDDGFYVAGRGYLAAWPGGLLLRGVDSTYTPVALLDSPAVVGTAQTVLGAWPTNIFDEANVLRVTLLGGTLASATRAAVLQYANAALVGNEIIQFRTASLVSGTTYDLSGLLRGRKGTEWAIGGHVAGERFVLLSGATPSSALRRVLNSPLNQAVNYKANTIGAPIGQAPVISFTNTGGALRPYMPVRLRPIKQANGDILIQWRRRGRLANEWRDGIDVPLSEETERYEVDIYDPDFVGILRTLAVGTTEAVYSVANATADFGSVPATLNVVVTQVSARAGRGYPARETLATATFTYARTWDDNSVSGLTLFGSSPSHAATASRYSLTAAGNQDARARIDAIGNVQNFALEADVEVRGGGDYSGFIYRTSTWSNTLNTWAWRLGIDTGGGQLRTGSNSGSNLGNTVQASWSTSYSTGQILRVRLEVNGRRHRVLVNGAEVLVHDSDVHNNAGQIALYHGQVGVSGSTTTFDNLAVNY